MSVADRLVPIAGQWVVWQDAITPAAPAPSPLNGRVFLNSELGPQRNRRRAILSGPWAGMTTPTTRIQSAGEVELFTCPTCLCVFGMPGGACRIHRNADWAANECPDCFHAFCGCGRPVEVPGGICVICSGEWLISPEGGVSAYIPGRRRLPRVWGSTRDADYKEQRVYQPTRITGAGRIATITESQREVMRKDVWVHVIGGTPWVTLDEDGTRHFQHYHTGCWGNIHFTDPTPEAIVTRAMNALDLINADSPMHSRPEGLPAIDRIQHTPFVADSENNWDLNVIYAEEALRETIREILSRQERVGLAVPNGVLVVGAGGVGWHTSMQLAMIGVPQLFIMDNDLVDSSNLARIPLTRDHVGMCKSRALTDFINAYTWRNRMQSLRAVNLEARLTDVMVRDTARLPARLRQALEGNLINVVVDTTDNIEAQKTIYDFANHRNLRYVRAGYDGGWHVTVSSRRAPDWEIPGANPGYAVPSWIGGAQYVATLAVTKICQRPELEVTQDIRDVFGHYHDPLMEVPEAERTETRMPVEAAGAAVVEAVVRAEVRPVDELTWSTVDVWNTQPEGVVEVGLPEGTGDDIWHEDDDEDDDRDPDDF